MAAVRRSATAPADPPGPALAGRAVEGMTVVARSAPKTVLGGAVGAGVEFAEEVVEVQPSNGRPVQGTADRVHEPALAPPGRTPDVEVLAGRGRGGAPTQRPSGGLGQRAGDAELAGVEHQALGGRGVAHRVHQPGRPDPARTDFAKAHFARAARGGAGPGRARGRGGGERWGRGGTHGYESGPARPGRAKPRQMCARAVVGRLHNGGAGGV